MAIGDHNTSPYVTAWVVKVVSHSQTVLGWSTALIRLVHDTHRNVFDTHYHQILAGRQHVILCIGSCPDSTACMTVAVDCGHLVT